MYKKGKKIKSIIRTKRKNLSKRVKMIGHSLKHSGMLAVILEGNG